MLLILFNRGGGTVAPPSAVTAKRMLYLKGHDGTASSLAGDSLWPALKGDAAHLPVVLAGNAAWPALKGNDSTRKKLEGDNG